MDAALWVCITLVLWFPFLEDMLDDWRADVVDEDAWF